VRGHGTGYVPSPTRDIRDWVHYLNENEPQAFRRTFVDIGCGEGVVLTRWAKLTRALGFQQDMIGIESDPELIGLADAYLRRAGVQNVDLWQADATRVDYRAQTAGPLLCWLFNPFDVESVQRWSDAVNGIDTEVIANNPDHVKALIDKGWLMRHMMPHEWPRNAWFQLWNGVWSD